MTKIKTTDKNTKTIQNYLCCKNTKQIWKRSNRNITYCILLLLSDANPGGGEGGEIHLIIVANLHCNHCKHQHSQFKSYDHSKKLIYYGDHCWDSGFRKSVFPKGWWTKSNPPLSACNNGILKDKRHHKCDCEEF